MSTRARDLSASYHVVVVGTELGGLMYAALAARAGYRVGVVGQGDRPNAYRHGGHVFLRQPERFYGFGTSPVVAQVFGELSMAMEMRNRPRPVEPTLQAVLPRRRLDVPREPARWRRELARELEDGGEALLAFERWAAEWADQTHALLAADVPLPPQGFRAAQRYRRAVAPAAALLEGLGLEGRSPLAGARDGGASRALVEGALAHLVGLRGRPLAPLALVRLWTHLRAGLYRVPGGLDGLKNLFLTKIREQCCDWRPDAVVEEVVMRRGRAAEVILAGRGERLGCEVLVANGDARRFLHLIPPDAQNARFHADLAAREPAAWRLTVNLAVDPRVIPAGMGPEVLVASQPLGSLDGPDCLWVSRPGVTPFAEGEGRPGPGVLTVTCLLPARGIAPGAPALRRAVAEIRARLREVIPWLDEHLLAVHVPALPRPERDDVDPTALLPVMGEALPGTLDVGAVAPDTPYRNVLLGGDTLFSGLGFEGACLGALHTLRATQGLLRLRVPRPDLR